MRRPSCLLLRCLIALLLSPGGVAPAWAHPLIQNRLTLTFGPEPTAVRLGVEVTLREITLAQHVDPCADGGYDVDALAGAARRHADYVLAHLHLSTGADGGGERPGTLAALVAPERFSSAEGTRYRYELVYPLPERPAAVTLRHDTLREFPYAPGVAWIVFYVVEFPSDGPGGPRTDLLRPEVPAEFPTGWAAAGAR